MPKTRRRIQLAMALCVAVGLDPLTGGAIGGESARSTGDAVARDFGEVVEVNLVNIDVVATDRKGGLITDLRREEFEVLEDGQPMQISHFSLLRGEAGAGARLEVGKPPVGSAATHGPVGAPGEPSWLVVYVDNLHSRLFERNRALRQLQTVLAEGTPGVDRVMVASYDRSLKIRQKFTLDRERVGSTLRAMESARADGDRYDDEQRRLIKVVESAVSPKDALEAIRPFASQARGDLWGSLGALEEMIRQLAGLPGRRSILFLSGGLPLKPGAALFNAIEYRFPGLLGIHEMMLYDQSERFEDLGRLANANDVTFHTFDVAGVRSAGSSGVEEELKRVVAISANIDADVRTNLQLPLRQMADSTGGRAILNRNDALPALRDLSAELGSYYSLGYVPDRPADERFHRIKVRVRRQGVVLRHRDGYRDRAPSVRMRDRLHAALAHGVVENALGVDLEVEPASTAAKDRFGVSLRVLVPLRGLALLPEGKEYRGRFRLYLAAMDETGGMSEIVEIPATLAVAGDELEAARSRWWRLSQQLEMRGGRQTLAVGVRDEQGLVTAFTTRTIDVGW